MKVVLVLALMLVAASAAPEKRLFNFDDLLHQIGDAFTHTFNAAKDTFNSLTSGLDINFDSVVDQLVSMIDSGTTEAACHTACVGAAATILGPAAALAGSVCDPACKAALSKLEETAGK